MNERKYKAGYYRARAVAGTEQHGYAAGGGEQISVELDVQISDQEIVRLTSILAFAGNAGPISIERLKALGWDGSNELRGIDANEVEVEIKYSVPPGKTEERMEVEIKTGGGRFKFKKPMGDAERRGFMASLSKQAAQLATGGGPRPAQAPPATSNDPTSFPHGANAPPQQQYKL